jgi:hypothetical protein
MGELIDGGKYWLGATWGTYSKEHNCFNLGNSFVLVGDTWFSNKRTDERDPALFVEGKFKG